MFISFRALFLSACCKFAVTWALLGGTSYAQFYCVTGGKWIEGLQACMYQNVTTASSTNITLWSLGSLGTVIPRNQDDLVKIHVRLTSNIEANPIPSLLFTLERGGVARIVNSSTVQEARSSDTTEYAFMFPLRVLQQSNVLHVTRVELVIQMASYYRGYYVHYTALFHVHSSSTQLSGDEAALLGSSVAECCFPQPVTTQGLFHWCARWGSSLNDVSILNPCALPETLCARNGSLLKLVFTGGLTCTNANAERVVALANLPSLAWLDLSFSSLTFPLQDLAGLMARPGLQWLILRHAGLTGLLPGVVASPTATEADAAAEPAWPAPIYTSPVDVQVEQPSRGNTEVVGSAFRNSINGNASSGGGGSSSRDADGDVACAALAPPGRRSLVLSDNNLTGRVPNCLASHATLEELKLDRNSLTGLPSTWSSAVSMVDMDVSSNPALVGPITSLPPSLTRLNVSFTALGGGLPAPLPRPLVVADFERARLSGPINAPSVWGLHANASPKASGSGSGSGQSALTMLSLRNNALEGGLPELLPPALRFFFLDNNKLNGTLPALPPNLSYFNCSHNRFSGLLIAGQPPNASILDFSLNGFSGALPPSLARLPVLTYLNVSRNNLEGSIEAFSSQLTADNVLLALDLSFNFFSGSLPPALGQLAVLERDKFSTFPRLLDISYNSFAGDVPSYMHEVLPIVAISCKCIAVVAEGNHFTCPERLYPTSPDRLYILQNFFNLPCFDDGTVEGRSGCRYNLGQWLAGGPPAVCHDMLPRALRNLSLEQVMALDRGMFMPGPGRSFNTSTDTVTFEDFTITFGLKRKGSNRWPLINVLTVLLAALCGLFALVALFFVGVVWISRRLVRWRYLRAPRQLPWRLRPRQRWFFWRTGLEREAPQQQHEGEDEELEQRQQQEPQYPELNEGGSDGVPGERRIRSGGGAGGGDGGSGGHGHVGLVLAANSTDPVLPGDLELAFWQPLADGAPTGTARPPSEVESSAWTAADTAGGTTAAAPAAVGTTVAPRASTTAAQFLSEVVPSSQGVETSGTGGGSGGGSRRQQIRARSGNSVPWFERAAATAAARPFRSARSAAGLGEVCVVVAAVAEAAASSSSSSSWSLRTTRQSGHGSNARLPTTTTTPRPPRPPRLEAPVPPQPPPQPAPPGAGTATATSEPSTQQPTLRLPSQTATSQQTLPPPPPPPPAPPPAPLPLPVDADDDTTVDTTANTVRVAAEAAVRITIDTRM